MFITIVAIVLLSISASTIFYIKNTNMTATVLPAVLVDLTNDVRKSNNEDTLTRSDILDTAARLKAQDMASIGYFAHTSPKGITPWYWFDKAGYMFTYAGENLAINFTESVDVEDAWLNSPTHKANILNGHFSQIGIATMDGIYQGRPTTYVVQMFGTPAFATNISDATEALVEKTAPVTPPKETPKQQSIPKPASTTPTTVALVPVVKGESATQTEKLETITDTKEFIAVKNNTVTEDTTPKNAPAHYSKWSDRFIFMTPAYVDTLYKIFIILVLLGLLCMTVVEIKRQHPKNIMYGILLLVIILCLIYINRTMFVTSFLA